MRIIDNILGIGGHGYLDPSYVVIHETAGPGAPAANLVSWWANGGGLPVHYVGDWTGDCYYCVPEDQVCWQVGNGNQYVIGIELCHATNSEDFEAVWRLGVEWAAWQLSKRGWGTDRLISHYQCGQMWGGTDHTDPIGYFEEFGRSWDEFVSDVQKELDGGMSEWIKDDNGKWWYKHADGSYTRDDWELIDSKWYYFDHDGYMCSGWLDWGGDWYYLQPKTDDTGESYGYMVTGWKLINWKGANRWFFFQRKVPKSGRMLHNGFKIIDGKWYAFDKNGVLVTDSSKISINKKTGRMIIKPMV